MTARSVSMSSTTPTSFKWVGIIVLTVLAILVGAALLPTNTQVAVAGEITASGGNGKVQTYGAELNVTIRATTDGTSCNYNPYWSDGTQIGSGFPFSCDEEGYQNLLEQLHKTGKIPDGIYNALKGVKFW